MTAIAAGAESCGAIGANTRRQRHRQRRPWNWRTRSSRAASRPEASATPTESGDVVATHSNFNSSDPGSEGESRSTAGGNQTAAPLFVDAANGDYREAAGSPTIDAGVADQLGPLDLAGSPGSRRRRPTSAPSSSSRPVGADPVAGGQAGRLPGRQRRPARSPAARKSGGAGRGDGQLRALGGGQRRTSASSGRSRAARSAKRCVKQTAANKGAQEMRPLQAPQGRLLRLRGRRPEQLQVLRPARRQASEAGVLPADRGGGRRGPESRLQDRQMRLPPTAAATLVLALAIPAAAAAAQRYAAPEGKGPEPCTQAAPCSLKNAVTKAKSNDEVIVTAGTYSAGRSDLPARIGNEHLRPRGLRRADAGHHLRPPGRCDLDLGVKDRLSYLDVSNTGTSSGSAVACSSGAKSTGSAPPPWANRQAGYRCRGPASSATASRSPPANPRSGSRRAGSPTARPRFCAT